MRVLVVDDEEVIRDVLGTLLTREGYEVSAAASAGEAISIFENDTYDVVLLDLMLPIARASTSCATSGAAIPTRSS
jgi:DNA-binding response OmpR family regulator